MSFEVKTYHITRTHDTLWSCKCRVWGPIRRQIQWIFEYYWHVYSPHLSHRALKLPLGTSNYWHNQRKLKQGYTCSPSTFYFLFADCHFLAKLRRSKFSPISKVTSKSIIRTSFLARIPQLLSFLWIAQAKLDHPGSNKLPIWI